MSDQVFLQYGLNPDDHEDGQHLALVSVEEVESGRSALVCPYCRAPLIARKGNINQLHFAHDGETCRESRTSIAMSIPLYDEIATLPGLLASDLRLLTHILKRDQLNQSQFRGLSIKGNVIAMNRTGEPALWRKCHLLQWHVASCFFNPLLQLVFGFHFLKFLVTNPRTTVLFLGTCRKGAKSPDLSSSYSRK